MIFNHSPYSKLFKWPGPGGVFPVYPVFRSTHVHTQISHRIPLQPFRLERLSHWSISWQVWFDPNLQLGRVWLHKFASERPVQKYPKMTNPLEVGEVSGHMWLHTYGVLEVIIALYQACIIPSKACILNHPTVAQWILVGTDYNPAYLSQVGCLQWLKPVYPLNPVVYHQVPYSNGHKLGVNPIFRQFPICPNISKYHIAGCIFHIPFYSASHILAPFRSTRNPSSLETSWAPMALSYNGRCSARVPHAPGREDHGFANNGKQGH